VLFFFLRKKKKKDLNSFSFSTNYQTAEFQSVINRCFTSVSLNEQSLSEMSIVWSVILFYFLFFQRIIKKIFFFFFLQVVQLIK